MTNRTCSIDGCSKPEKSRGWCGAHYARWRRNGDPLTDRRPKAKPCARPDCSERSSSRGLCGRHYARARRDGEVTTEACGANDCDRFAWARGLCDLHYTRWRKHGDPNHVAVIIGDDASRFWSKVEVAHPLGCWIWSGSNSGRYATFAYYEDGTKFSIGTHRWAYEFFHGPIPEGLVLDHLCRNTLCVNPDHLEPVTGYVNFVRGYSPVAIKHRSLLPN